MKINELMIGDWVCYGNCDIPTQIKSIDMEYVYIEDSINSCWLSDKQIKPIPITEENLKLNNFVCIIEDDDGYSEYAYKVQIKDSSVRLGIDQRTIGIEIINDDKDRQFRSTTLEYIHELQHVLRLCGLNELADNWRVKV